MNQRWHLRLATYRDPSEQIQTSAYEVAEIADDGSAGKPHTPKGFVEQHHYSGSFPAARFRFGLYRGEQLEGVAVFSHPCNDLVLTNTFPWISEARAAVELGRFVLLNSVKGNGETWFLGRCFEVLRSKSLVGVVSRSDPIARRAADGSQVFPGHLGTIYQAHNAVYLGRATPRTLKILPDGTSFDARAQQKIRGRERGIDYAVGILRSFGAPPLEGDPVEWLATWSARLTRNMRHPGNHSYAWTLAKRDRRYLAAKALPYPKLQRAA